MQNMRPEIIAGLLIPFVGTTLGALCVFFMKGELNRRMERGLQGFAAGVMTAASVWSLLIPAMEQSEPMGRLAFLPAVLGFMVGMSFLLFLDHVIPHQHLHSEEAEGPDVRMAPVNKLLFAVTLHNIPEGMAVGVALAGIATGATGMTMGGALTLALGIAIQNFPEGAIVSMPLHTEGLSKGQAFRAGTLSGLVEPVGGLVTLLAAGFVVPILPYLLSFAAGAMMYVVVEELIPEMSEGAHSNIGPMAFALGFAVMMMLDVALG